MFKQLDNFKNWVNSEVDKKLDKDPFSSLPLKMRIGIFILLGCFVVSRGSVLFMVVMPGINRELSIAGFFSGSVIYIACWLLGMVGLALAGKDSIKYPIYFLAKLLKRLFPRYFAES